MCTIGTKFCISFALENSPATFQSFVNEVVSKNSKKKKKIPDIDVTKGYNFHICFIFIE